MRIFLVGSGPSLNETNLDLIVGEKSFGLNRCHLIFPRTKWRPTYLMWADMPQRNDDWVALIEHIVSGRECYVRDDVCNRLLGKWNAYPTPLIAELPAWVHPWKHHHNHIGVALGDWPEYWCFPQEDDALCKFGNGMGPAMQQAIKLGYNELYLLGCDLNYHIPAGEDDCNHFSLDYDGDLELRAQKQADYFNALGLAMHQLALEWCEKAGIKVYNATVGGKLEVYPRVVLEDVCAVS